MTRPAYLREGSDSSFPSATDSRENSIELAGLRKKPLVALLTCLAILAILATFLLIMNILLLVSLQMNHKGMRFIRFHTVTNQRNGELEKIVQFHGNNIDLGKVVTNGQVNGYPHQDMTISGSRVIVSGEENGTQMILQENGCNLKDVDQFHIMLNANNRTIFSAGHPMIVIDRRIKKISTSKFITNKIRAPVDEDLRISIDNLSVRGNEGVRMESNVIKISSVTQTVFNTSRDGSIHLSGTVRVGSASKNLPLSPSPALSASVEAFRVCVCHGPKAKLYLTPGNKPCLATTDIC